MMVSQLSGPSCSSRRSETFTPAAHTKRSTPSPSPILTTVRPTSSASETSRAWGTKEPDRIRPSPAPSSIVVFRRASPCTFAPASAKRLAVASPTPLLTPVTIAVFPASGALSTTNPPSRRGRPSPAPTARARARRRLRAPSLAATPAAAPRSPPALRRATRGPARSPPPCTRTSPEDRTAPARRRGSGASSRRRAARPSRPAPRPQKHLDGHPARRLRAHGVYNQVHPEPLRNLLQRLPRLRRGFVRLVRPQPQRRLPACLVRLDDVYARDARVDGGLQAHQADRPCPDHDRVLDGALACRT